MAQKIIRSTISTSSRVPCSGRESPFKEGHTETGTNLTSGHFKGVELRGETEDFFFLR